MGAARGIGKVYSMGIAAEGGKVVVSDILDGEETVKEIRKAGGEAMYVHADVSDEKVWKVWPGRSTVVMVESMGWSITPPSSPI